MHCILIGYGYWGKIIKKYIDSSSKFELIEIYDHHLSNSVSLESLLKNNDIEVAFVCVPVDAHYKVVKMLLEYHIHVFCEKPLCKSKIDVENLYDVAKKNGCILFTDYIYTVSPSILEMKKYIRNFGRILYIEMSIRQFGKFYATDHVFDVIGVHMMSALIFLLDTNLGDIKVDFVNVIKKGKNGLPDVGTVYLNLPDEIKCKIECSLVSAEKERKIQVLCEKGIVIFDMLGERTIRVISYSEEKGTRVIYENKHDESNNLVYMLENFYHTIMTKDTKNEDITRQTSLVSERINKWIAEN